ncbi:MAG: hypothetical protein JKY17_08995 [Magnetovibrio sp.]|nr:hypothetical protein [Magnetovibrio sp.]
MSNDTRTEMQAAFVRHLVCKGCTQTEAARRAGYTNEGQRAWELMQKPHILEAIHKERSRLIEGDLANVAMKTLHDVMEDKEAPASARVSAAKAAFNIGGHTKKADMAPSRDKELSEMSIEELEALVIRGEKSLDMQENAETTLN